MTGAPSLSELKVKIFADGADLDGIREMSADSLIKGFTTNPTLMRRAGVNDYKDFTLEVLRVVANRPVSFEAFADEFEEMAGQADVGAASDGVLARQGLVDDLRIRTGERDHLFRQLADCDLDRVPQIDRSGPAGR